MTPGTRVRWGTRDAIVRANFVPTDPPSLYDGWVVVEVVPSIGWPVWLTMVDPRDLEVLP